MDRARRASEEWTRERPDLPTLPMTLLGRLAEASQRITQERLRPFFALHGLQAGEFDVLATLRRAGHPYRLTPTALYEATMVTSGAMTGRIDRLERQELVERLDDPADRRGTLVALTEGGFRLIDTILPDHIENALRILAPLPPQQQQILDEMLEKLIAGLTPAPSI